MLKLKPIRSYLCDICVLCGTIKMMLTAKNAKNFAKFAELLELNRETTKWRSFSYITAEGAKGAEELG
jgi:hypothetical protein